MHDKWLYFCRKYGVSSTDPTQADVNVYISWLASVGSWAEKRDGAGEAMKFASIQKYVQYVGRALRTLHKTDSTVIESLQTHWALQATKRLLGETKQRARPITLEELKSACASVEGPLEFVLAFRVIALTAWFAALRLGQVLPTSEAHRVHTMTLADLQLSEDGQAVIVSYDRSKTDVFRGKLRKIAISACISDKRLCLRTALIELLDYRRRQGLPLDAPLWGLHKDLASFNKFVDVMQSLIPARESTPFEKGHVTGHSFRRGFTKAALLAGFSIDQIMLHGDWSHPDSVTNSYASGTVLPSVPMARHVQRIMTGASSFVAPGGNRVAAAAPSPTTVTQGHCPATWTFSAGNPYAHCHGPIDNSEALFRRARQWEFDQGQFSDGNPFREDHSNTLAQADQQQWLKKRARQWELANNPGLMDRNIKSSKSS